MHNRVKILDIYFYLGTYEMENCFQEGAHSTSADGTRRSPDSGADVERQRKCPAHRISARSTIKNHHRFGSLFGSKRKQLVHEGRLLMRHEGWAEHRLCKGKRILHPPANIQQIRFGEVAVSTVLWMLMQNPIVYYS